MLFSQEVNKLPSEKEIFFDFFSGKVIPEKISSSFNEDIIKIGDKTVTMNEDAEFCLNREDWFLASLVYKGNAFKAFEKYYLGEELPRPSIPTDEIVFQKEFHQREELSDVEIQKAHEWLEEEKEKNTLSPQEYVFDKKGIKIVFRYIPYFEEYIFKGGWDTVDLDGIHTTHSNGLATVWRNPVVELKIKYKFDFTLLISEEIPKHVRMILEDVLNKRGLKCQKKKKTRYSYDSQNL